MTDTLTVYRCWWSRGWVAQLGGSEVECDCPLEACWRVCEIELERRRVKRMYDWFYLISLVGLRRAVANRWRAWLRWRKRKEQA